MSLIKNPATDKWLALVINLPTANAALRMRIWRAMKALGCAVMRDGVYILPAGRGLRQTLRVHAEQIRQGGGHAYLLNVSTTSTEEKHEFQSLFDRSNEFQVLSEKIRVFHSTFQTLEAQESKRQLKEMRRDLENLSAIDFFPKPISYETEEALADAETAFLSSLSPAAKAHEESGIAQHALADYQSRQWVTHTPLSLGRLACIWLIHNHIDQTSSISWQQPMASCPAGAVSFAYHQAEFPVMTNLTTFECLLKSFNLNKDPALETMAQVIHSLELGGENLPEAEGVERLLQGARRNCKDDDELAESAMRVFDLLYGAYAG